MGDPISYPIKLVELEGVDGLYGTLRYVLMRDQSTSAERFQAATELLYRLGAVGKERDAFESMILDILEANFEGAKEETERKVAEWQAVTRGMIVGLGCKSCPHPGPESRRGSSESPLINSGGKAARSCLG